MCFMKHVWLHENVDGRMKDMVGAHLGELLVAVAVEAGCGAVHGVDDDFGERAVLQRHFPPRQLQQHNAKRPYVRRLVVPKLTT